MRFLIIILLAAIQVPFPFAANAQIPYNAPATSALLNSTFGAKAYPNTWTGVNTFGALTLSGPITSTGTNTFSGSNTFASALLAPTMSLSDSSMAVATTAFVKGQSYITSIGAPVQSIFGRTGVVIAVSGDYTTSLVTEGSNLYFTNSRAIGSTLTGYTSGAGTLSSSDTVLSAIQKLNGNLSAITVPVQSVFGRTGSVVSASGDYTTSQVTEGSNLYFTNGRSIGSTLTGFTASAGTISSTDSVLSALQKDAANSSANTTAILPIFQRR